MASFEWVPYSEEESAPASAPGAGDVEDEDIDVGEAQVTEAFRGYSDGRAREAEAIRVEKVMEEARREGARLKELMENPKAAAATTTTTATTTSWRRPARRRRRTGAGWTSSYARRRF